MWFPTKVSPIPHSNLASLDYTVRSIETMHRHSATPAESGTCVSIISGICSHMYSEYSHNDTHFHYSHDSQSYTSHTIFRRTFHAAC